MKRTTLAIFLFAALASAQGPGPGGRGRGFGPPPGGPEARVLGVEMGMPGRVVKNAAFSADIVTESSRVLQDGNRIRQTTTVKVYRDSEGRTRREQSPNLNGLSSNASMPSLIFIHDPVAGSAITLNAKDKTGTRSTFTPGQGRGPNPQGRGPMGPNGTSPRTGMQADAPRPRRAGSTDPNVKTESLGTRSFDGVMADGRRTTMTIPAGQMGNDLPIQVVTETWYSSELQATVYQKRTDPRNGETVTRFTNISRVEPSLTLFETPGDFKVTESARARRGGPIQ